MSLEGGAPSAALAGRCTGMQDAAPAREWRLPDDGREGNSWGSGRLVLPGVASEHVFCKHEHLCHEWYIEKVQKFRRGRFLCLVDG